MLFRVVPPKLFKNSLLVCACGWAIYVFFRFYQSTPNPFPFWMESTRGGGAQSYSLPAFALQWGRFFLIAGVGFLVLGAQWISGNWIRKWLGLFSGHQWIDTAMEWGIGLWFLTTGWLALGFLGLWFPVLLRMFLLLMMIIFAWLKRGDGWRLRWGATSVLRPVPISVRLLVLLGFGYVMIDFLHAFIPETFYDTLGYLLGVPEGWLLNHVIRDNPENFSSGMAHDAGLYYLNGLIWRGTEVAKFLGVLSIPACAFIVGGWVERYTNRNAAWVAMGVTLTFPLLSLNAWAARADGWMAFFLLLTFYSLDHWGNAERGSSGRWLFVAGLSAGMAFSMKYSAAFGLASLIFAYADRLFVKKGECGKWLPGLCGFLLSVGPWFLKNAVFTGNPFYPYGQRWVGGRPLAEGVSEVLLRKNHLFEVSGLREWLRLPWTLTMPGSPFAQMTGPFLLALVPLLFLFRSRLVGFCRPVLASGIFILVGVAFSRNLRFEMAAFLLLGGALVVLAFQEWGESGLKGLALVFSGLAVLNLAYLGVLSCSQFDPWRLWTGVETRNQYLTRQLPDSYFPMANWIHQSLPKDARLLVVGDARGLYYDVDRITNWIDDPPLLVDWIKQSRDVGDLHRFFHRSGVTHLAVNIRQGVNAALQNGNAYRMGSEEWERWVGFLQRYGSVVYREPWLVVYEITANPKPNPGVLFDAIPLLSEPATRWFQARGEARPLEQQAALDGLKWLVPEENILQTPEMGMSP